MYYTIHILNMYIYRLINLWFFELIYLFANTS